MVGSGAGFESLPPSSFDGIVYRIATARYAGNVASMRGSFIHGARYNIRTYFGALYTSLAQQIAEREVKQYFTRPPVVGLVLATFRVRLSRVLDLRSAKLLRAIKLKRSQLVAPDYAITQEIGLRAWEANWEGLLIPSAVSPNDTNLAILLDNQSPTWQIALKRIRRFDLE